MRKFTIYMDLELYEFAALLAGEHIEAEEILNEFLRAENNKYSALIHFPLPKLGAECPHDAEILDQGIIQVSLIAHEALWQEAAQNFNADGFLSTEDCLLGLLNGRLMNAMAQYDDDHFDYNGDWRPKWLQEKLHEQGAYELYTGFEDGDDFPF